MRARPGRHRAWPPPAVGGGHTVRAECSTTALRDASFRLHRVHSEMGCERGSRTSPCQRDGWDGKSTTGAAPVSASAFPVVTSGSRACRRHIGATGAGPTRMLALGRDRCGGGPGTGQTHQAGAAGTAAPTRGGVPSRWRRCGTDRDLTRGKSPLRARQGWG